MTENMNAKILTEEKDLKAAGPTSWESLKKLGIGISWTWSQWIPNGFVTMLVGQVGLGKSTLALRISASCLIGSEWLDGSPYLGDPGNIIWCESESGHFMNLDRAQRWNLPLNKIICPLEDPSEDFNLSNPDHRKALEEKLQDKKIRLIVIDSLRGAVEGDENNSEFIRQLKYLAVLAQKYQLPILIVHHLRKKSKNDSMEYIDIDRIRGSSAIAQIPRMVIAINVPNQDFPDKRKLSVIKTNLGKKPEPIGITITDHGIEVITDIENFARPKNTTQRDLAKDFLTEFLKDGFKLSKEIYSVGKDKGLDKQTLQRAKKDLGIVTGKEGKIWFWKFPTDE